MFVDDVDNLLSQGFVDFKIHVGNVNRGLNGLVSSLFVKFSARAILTVPRSTPEIIYVPAFDVPPRWQSGLQTAPIRSRQPSLSGVAFHYGTIKAISIGGGWA